VDSRAPCLSLHWRQSELAAPALAQVLQPAASESAPAASALQTPARVSAVEW
jgi:hypothetical protein